MIRKGIYIHHIGVLLPSGAPSTVTKMLWRRWKGRFALVFSFFLGSLLTLWLFCRSTQFELSAEQPVVVWSSPMVPLASFRDELEATEFTQERVTTSLPAGQTLPPYPEIEEDQKLILTPHSCTANTFLLIVVISSSSNFEARKAIRLSWGKSLKSQSTYEVIFSVGCDADSDARVEKEASKSGDVLRGNFRDAYPGNEFHTMKTLTALKWATSLCSSAKYVLKVPSTSFVNVPQTVTWLRSLSQESGQSYKADFYAGSCHGANDEGPTPIRDPQSMWYIPLSYWPDPHLPVYVSSVGIIFSIDVAGWIASASTEVRPIHIDDVYFGILARRLGITCANESPRFDLSYSTMLTECKDLQFCVIGNVPAKDMNYLYQNAAVLREIC